MRGDKGQREFNFPPGGNGKIVMDTQLEGYEKVLGDISQRQAEILKLARSSGEKGVTLFELCAFLGLPPNSVSGRITELTTAGKLADSGRRRKNPFSGVKCAVWVASEYVGVQ